jgi:large subunit ribosomal protein L4
MFNLQVKDSEGKDKETIKLDEAIFNAKMLPSSVYQVVNAWRANQRKGLASTKTRGEVSGGGKKPWKQKGTGRARVGSIRSPLWRHGGVIFGPHPRDFGFRIPKKMKALALKFALSAKVKENNFIVVDDLAIKEPKTKELVNILANLSISRESKRVLVVLDKIETKLRQAARNIDFFSLELAEKINTYEVLASRKVVITQKALKVLVERLRNEI